MSQQIFDFECQSINGEKVPLSQYRDKVVMVVNTASYCGFTPQFKGLEYLYRTYKDKGFVVLGFPCNQFSQEPMDNDRISDFCVRNYGVSFPMFAKVNINGDAADPLFTHLKSQATGLFGIRAIKYNFTKFLIDRKGNVVGRFGPATFPRRMSNRIERLLS
jgi:glutathione peroxidase